MSYVTSLMEDVKAKNPAEPEFHQAVEEVAVPGVHFDDAPAASKGLGETGHLGHQPASAIRLGSRTRL